MAQHPSFKLREMFIFSIDWLLIVIEQKLSKSLFKTYLPKDPAASPPLDVTGFLSIWKLIHFIHFLGGIVQGVSVPCCVALSSPGCATPESKTDQGQLVPSLSQRNSESEKDCTSALT